MVIFFIEYKFIMGKLLTTNVLEYLDSMTLLKAGTVKIRSWWILDHQSNL